MSDLQEAHSRPLQLYWTPLLFFTVLQLGVLVILTRVGDRGISVYNFGILPLCVIVGVLFGPRLRFTRSAVRYLLFFAILIVLITIVRLPEVPSKVVVAHLLVLGAAVATGIIGIETPFRAILGSLLGTAAIVGVFDTLALVGIIPVANTAATVFPGTDYGGIGVATSFGTHGTIVGSGIVAAGGIANQVRDRRRWALIAVSGWLFMMLIFSQSRSSVVATIAGIVIVLAYRYRRHLSTPLLLVGLATGSAGIGLLVTLRLSTIKARLNGLFEGAAIVERNPLTGIGWDVYYPVYSNKVLHNTPMNYYVADGLVVGLLFTLLLVYPFIVFLRQTITSELDRLGPLFVALGLYAVVFVEIMLYKSTPSVHTAVFAILVCTVCGRQDE